MIETIVTIEKQKNLRKRRNKFHKRSSQIESFFYERNLFWSTIPAKIQFNKNIEVMYGAVWLYSILSNKMIAKIAPRISCLLGSILEVFGSSAMRQRKKYSVPVVRKKKGISRNIHVAPSINIPVNPRINFTFFVLYTIYKPNITLTINATSIPQYLLLAHCHPKAGVSKIPI